MLLLSAGLATAAMLAEASLRIYARINTSFGRVYGALDLLSLQIEPLGTIGYRQKPNSTFRFRNGTTATSNAMGFRGPTVPIPKPPGIFRILLLGGSTTHGWAVNDDETIDAYMRRLLKQRYPASAFEVVNLAFDGYDSYQIVERLRTDGLRLDPDLTIVNSGINDVRNARFHDLQDPDPRTFLWQAALNLQRNHLSRTLTLWNRLKHLSYLARLPAFVRSRTVTLRFFGHERGKIFPNPAAVEYFGRNLRRIAALFRLRAVPILFSSPPSALTTKFAPHDTSQSGYWLGDASTTEEYRLALAERMRKVSTELAREGYPTAYVNHKLSEAMFLDDCHLTPEGNRRLARDFVDAAEPYIIAHQNSTPSTLSRVD